jgi:pimeloyl-ACP methyl ester carboxylesterase
MTIGPKSILLVHGACHGAWCWNLLVPVLTSRGHRVKAIDLPGRAGNGRPGWGPTLRSYSQAVADAAAAMDGPVVAVGHSMGGQMISGAAEIAPESFERLVMLSAFLPVSGDSIASLSAHNQDTALPSATAVSLIRGQLRILADAAAPVFYGDCTAAMVAWATARLSPESVRPSMAKITLTDGRFGSVPRSYIRLAQDRAITPSFQDWMLSRQPCERTITLEASHSPFLSMPDELMRAIEEAAS